MEQVSPPGVFQIPVGTGVSDFIGVGDLVGDFVGVLVGVMVVVIPIQAPLEQPEGQVYETLATEVDVEQ